MAEDINLLPQEAAEKETKKGTYNRTVNIAAIVSLLVVAAILLGLFGYQLFLSTTIKRIDSQTKEAEQNILDQSRKEITHRALVEKLEDASKFLSSQLRYSSDYKIIINVLKKSKATLTEGKLDNDGSFSVTGEAKSSRNLQKFINGLTSTGVNDDLNEVRLVSLTKIPKEPYKFVIDYKVLKKGLLEETSNSQGESQ
jgi:hypothetical protein